MLLAPALGEPPRAVAERLGAALQDAARRRASRRSRSPGPGFLNLFLPTPGTSPRSTTCSRAGDGVRRAAPQRRAHPGRVRLRQPDRPADRGVRAATPRSATRSRGSSSWPATRSSASTTSTTAAARSSGSAQSILARARGEEPPEDGYQGEYVAELAAQIPDAAAKSPDELARGRRRDPDGRHPRDARALPRALRPLVPRGARSTRASRAPWDRAREQLVADGHAYQQRGRAVAAHDRARRRREGPPARALHRRADLPRGRRRLPLGQARARLRPRWSTCSAPTTTATSRGCKAILAAGGADPDRLVVPLLQFVHVVEGGERASMSKRRGDFVDARGADRRDRRRRHALLHAVALGRLDRRPRPRRSRASSRPRTRSTTCSTRTRGSPRCCARRARSASPRRWPRRARGWRWSRPSASWSRSCSRSRPRWPRRPSAARRTGSPSTRSRLAQAFTAFYRDCQRRRRRAARRSSRSGSRSASPTQRVIARSLGLLGVTAPDDDVSSARRPASAGSGRAKW